MKKLIALAAAAMMLLSLFTACGKEPAANNDNDTEKTTTFTVGFDAEFPPYGYQDENGEYVGFDLDLAAEVCTRNGWELVKKPINWDSKDMELNTRSSAASGTVLPCRAVRISTPRARPMWITVR